MLRKPDPPKTTSLLTVLVSIIRSKRVTSDDQRKI